MARNPVMQRKGKPSVVIAIGDHGDSGEGPESADEMQGAEPVQCPECGCQFMPGDSPEQYDEAQPQADGAGPVA